MKSISYAIWNFIMLIIGGGIVCIQLVIGFIILDVIRYVKFIFLFLFFLPSIFIHFILEFLFFISIFFKLFIFFILVSFLKSGINLQLFLDPLLQRDSGNLQQFHKLYLLR